MLFQHFDSDLTHVLFVYILPSHHMNLRDQPWKILWCRTDIRSCKFSAKVSLMLDSPFLVSSLCKLNNISLCFNLQTAYFLQGKQCFFFWTHPQCFGPLGRFQHNIKIFLLRWPLFPDYPFLVTMAKVRSSRPDMFCKKLFLEILQNF